MGEWIAAQWAGDCSESARQADAAKGSGISHADMSLYRSTVTYIVAATSSIMHKTASSNTHAADQQCDGLASDRVQRSKAQAVVSSFDRFNKSIHKTQAVSVLLRAVPSAALRPPAVHSPAPPFRFR